MLDRSGGTLIEDMSGWVITVPCMIDKQKAEIRAYMSQREKDEVVRRNEWISKFDVAGNYSVERLYPKFSSTAIFLKRLVTQLTDALQVFYGISMTVTKAFAEGIRRVTRYLSTIGQFKIGNAFFSLGHG